MRLVPILVGLLLLILGVAAYYSIPNVHETESVSLRSFAGPEQKYIDTGGTFTTTPINVTVTPGGNSTLVVNMTVTETSGASSQVSLRISSPAATLYDGTVSNQTIQIPISTSGSCNLIFDNTAGTTPKIASYVVYVKRNSTVETVSYDGTGSWFGLCLGAVGVLGVVYGVTRKTVIPWE